MTDAARHTEQQAYRLTIAVQWVDDNAKVAILAQLKPPRPITLRGGVDDSVIAVLLTNLSEKKPHQYSV